MKPITITTIQGLERLKLHLDSRQLPITVTVKDYKNTRSLQANAKLWAMLGEISEQVNYHGQKYTPDDWKDILTCSLSSELRMAPTTDGQRIVLLGYRTSKMTMKKMNELIEFMLAFGAEHKVVFSDPSDVMHSER